MSENIKNWFGQGAAWLAVVMAGLSFEMWLGLAGLGVSAFIALTNYRHREFEKRLMVERAEREAELHQLQASRLRANHPLVVDPCGVEP